MNKQKILERLEIYLKKFKSKLHSSVDTYAMLNLEYFDENIFYEKIKEQALENYRISQDFSINPIQFKKIYMECIYENAKKQYDYLKKMGWIEIKNGQYKITKKGKNNLKINKTFNKKDI